MEQEIINIEYYRMTITRALMKCWQCNESHSRVVSLSCGHHFCTKCLEELHSDWTEKCKQPCQCCFKLTVPKKSEIRNLTARRSLGTARRSLGTSRANKLLLSRESTYMYSELHFKRSSSYMASCL